MPPATALYPLLFHVTIHDLDLIFWYLNKKVKSVYAQSNSKALKAYNMEDSLFAVLRFEDDTLVNLESTWALPEGNASHLDAYMEILGTQGMAKVDCGYSGLWYSNAAATLFPDTMHWPQVGEQCRRRPERRADPLRQLRPGRQDAPRHRRRRPALPRAGLGHPEIYRHRRSDQVFLASFISFVPIRVYLWLKFWFFESRNNDPPSF